MIWEVSQKRKRVHSLTPFPMKIPHFWGPKDLISLPYHNNSHSKTTSQATHLKDMQYFICVLAGISLFSMSGRGVNTFSQISHEI